MESADALMKEKKLMAEAKYRNYMSNIDKALRNFEYSSEWADLISALGKLSKVSASGFLFFNNHFWTMYALIHVCTSPTIIVYNWSNW